MKLATLAKWFTLGGGTLSTSAAAGAFGKWSAAVGAVGGALVAIGAAIGSQTSAGHPNGAL